MMNKWACVLLLSISSLAAVEGENITSKIKRFYGQQDKSQVCADVINRYLLSSASHSGTANSKTPELDLRAYKPLLLLQLDYDRSKKIAPTGSVYDALRLDTLNFEIAFLDKDGLLVATLRSPNNTTSNFVLNLTSSGGQPTFIANSDFPKDSVTLKNINDRAISIRDIQRLQPDVILSFNQLAQTFLFLKANKIFVYRIQFHDSFELDRYVDLVIRGKK
jgi:hypothetical protein